MLSLFAALALTTAAAEPPRDPFASLLDTEGRAAVARPPLERATLDEMKLQGVVVNTASPRALIALRDGTSHVVRIGTNLGPNLGRVVAIRAGVVVVREAYTDFIGRRIERQVELVTAR